MYSYLVVFCDSCAPKRGTQIPFLWAGILGCSGIYETILGPYWPRQAGWEIADLAIS